MFINIRIDSFLRLIIYSDLICILFICLLLYSKLCLMSFFRFSVFFIDCIRFWIRIWFLFLFNLIFSSFFLFFTLVWTLRLICIITFLWLDFCFFIFGRRNFFTNFCFLLRTFFLATLFLWLQTPRSCCLFWFLWILWLFARFRLVVFMLAHRLYINEY